MGYIGNFGGWSQDMTNILCSCRGIGTKIGRYVSKGCILKVINLEEGASIAIQQLSTKIY